MYILLNYYNIVRQWQVKMISGAHWFPSWNVFQYSLFPLTLNWFTIELEIFRAISWELNQRPLGHKVDKNTTVLAASKFTASPSPVAADWLGTLPGYAHEI